MSQRSVNNVDNYKNNSIAYQLIEKFYTDKIASSGAPYINHIDEGLVILKSLNCRNTVLDAFCIHPLFQEDQHLKLNYNLAEISLLNQQVIIFAMEYRSVANEYLSNKPILNISDIRLSPIKEVNQLLIADKVQNKKNFMKYHSQTHTRSNDLLRYFNNWLKRLGVTNEDYKNFVQLIEKTIVA